MAFVLSAIGRGSAWAEAAIGRGAAWTEELCRLSWDKDIESGFFFFSVEGGRLLFSDANGTAGAVQAGDAVFFSGSSAEKDWTLFGLPWLRGDAKGAAITAQAPDADFVGGSSGEQDCTLLCFSVINRRRQGRSNCCAGGRRQDIRWVFYL